MRELRSLTTEAKRELVDLVYLTMFSIERDAKATVSVVTGSLRDRIRAYVGKDGAGLTVDSDHAEFVEKGTKPHEIRGKPVLSWVSSRTGNRTWAKIVRHPGFKGKPFVQPAYVKWMANFNVKSQEIIQRAMNG